jgi:hypothetical protein
LKRITAPVSPLPVIESAFFGEIRTKNEYPTAKTVDRLYDPARFSAYLPNLPAAHHGIVDVLVPGGVAA